MVNITCSYCYFYTYFIIIIIISLKILNFSVYVTPFQLLSQHLEKTYYVFFALYVYKRISVKSIVNIMKMLDIHSFQEFVLLDLSKRLS